MHVDDDKWYIRGALGMINADNVYKYTSLYLIIPKGMNIIHNYDTIKISIFILLLPYFTLAFKELLH